MKKPIIEVHHYGGDQPRVVLPPGMKAEVKFIDDQEENTRILSWKGVEVFHATNDYDLISDWWVATSPGMNMNSEDCFDLRDLPQVPEQKRKEYVILLDDSLNEEPEKPRPDSAEMEQLMRLMYAIDQDWLTEDGLQLPAKTAKT